MLGILIATFILLAALGALSDHLKRRRSRPRQTAPGGPTPVALFVVIHPDPDTWAVVGRYTREPIARLSDGDDAHRLAAAFSALLDCVDAEVAAAGGGEGQLKQLRTTARAQYSTAASMAHVRSLSDFYP